MTCAKCSQVKSAKSTDLSVLNTSHSHDQSTDSSNDQSGNNIRLNGFVSLCSDCIESSSKNLTNSSRDDQQVTIPVEVPLEALTPIVNPVEATQNSVIYIVSRMQ